MRLLKTAIHGHRCLGLLLLAVTGCGLQSEESLPAKHLGLVLFDTLRADRMSLYGHSLPTTPFLELVAQDFLRFEAVKATSP